MIERSANEIYAMVLRAGRGANIPLANAQDIAAATRWLGGNLAPVLHALETADHPTSVALVAPGAIDMALANPGRIQPINGGVSAPLLDALCQEAALRNGCQIIIEVKGDAATVCAQDGSPPTPPASARATVEDQVWDQLGQWAARTYVPESEASRLSGAGAGLHDND